MDGPEPDRAAAGCREHAFGGGSNSARARVDSADRAPRAGSAACGVANPVGSAAADCESSTPDRGAAIRAPRARACSARAVSSSVTSPSASGRADPAGNHRDLPGLLREDPRSTGDGSADPLPALQDRHRDARQLSRKAHLTILILSLLATALPFALSIRADGRVAFRGPPQIVLPETCLSHTLFHVDCPLCGMTRSFVELSRGHWRSSLAYHRLGWLVALTLLAQLPYRAIALSMRRTLPRPMGAVLATLLVIALLSNWLAL